MEFGERLRKTRIWRGLSQNKLAKNAGVSQAIVQRLEAGKRDGEKLSIAVAKRLAVALDVPMDYLCGLLDDLPSRPAMADALEGKAAIAVLCAQCERTLASIVA